MMVPLYQYLSYIERNPVSLQNDCERENVKAK
jgi:hypothetical protein